MFRFLMALLTGSCFGAGLALAGMTDPARIMAFLDVAGNWDPTLALVLVSAVAVAALGFQLARWRTSPLIADRFDRPARTDIDRALIAGAAIFGIGWGLVGYCPGPAIAALSYGSWDPAIFLAAAVVGAVIHSRVEATGGTTASLKSERV